MELADQVTAAAAAIITCSTALRRTCHAWVSHDYTPSRDAVHRRAAAHLPSPGHLETRFESVPCSDLATLQLHAALLPPSFHIGISSSIRYRASACIGASAIATTLCTRFTQHTRTAAAHRPTHAMTHARLIDFLCRSSALRTSRMHPQPSGWECRELQALRACTRCVDVAQAASTERTPVPTLKRATDSAHAHRCRCQCRCRCRSVRFRSGSGSGLEVGGERRRHDAWGRRIQCVYLGPR